MFPWNTRLSIYFRIIIVLPWWANAQLSYLLNKSGEDVGMQAAKPPAYSRSPIY